MLKACNPATLLRDGDLQARDVAEPAAIPQEPCAAVRMRLEGASRSLWRMPTYAVYWDEPGGGRFAGRISLDGACAELEGAASDGRTRRQIGFEDIAAVRYERGGLHVSRRDGVPLWLGSVDRPGALRELGERLRARLAAA
jgi:hypothetical protein